MAESESSISTDEAKNVDSPHGVKKPKKRSIVERELETNMTSRMTSPITGEGMSTSRYGRARRLKTGDFEKKPVIDIKSPTSEDTPNKSPTAYKMHAVNSPYKVQTPKHSSESNINNQIDSIYQENISLSRFNDHSPSPAKKSPKVYVRKDLIQTKDEDDDIILIKNLFSPIKHTLKSSKNVNTKSTEKCNGKESNLTENHIKKETDLTENNIKKETENCNVQQKINSTEKYNVKIEIDSTEKHDTNQNGIDNTSVVKTLDFDDNFKKRRKDNKPTISKNELFEIESKCPYQVGDLAWARMGTFPFWPCIVTRDPYSDMFVKKKLFGRVEHNILHVTFFADNGRRSWIVDNMLRPYAGRAEFESTRDKFTTEDKKKDPRLYAAFFISEKKQALWNISVDEAEAIMKEPKRFRIDILYDMIHKARASKKQTKSGRITRTDSDVSLSESLYDSLFSEDDSKTEEGRLRNRTRNPKSFDVSDVVTACLDNMAAKTGNSKIQRQSHMDRWLQKAKSKTPEKNQGKVVVKTERKSTRLRTSKSSKKAGTKSNSISNTDESNISDLDVKSSAGKDSSAEECMSVGDSKTSEGLKTPILLADDVEKPPTEQSTGVAIKQELIDQENDNDNRDTKPEERQEIRIDLVEINANSDETVEKQNLTSKSSENKNVEGIKSESDYQELVVKAECTNENSESFNKDIIDTTKVTNNCEAMDVDDNSTSESNVKLNSVQENVTSKMTSDENFCKSNMDSNIRVDDTKNLEPCANNKINSITDSSGAVKESKICEMMEVDDKLPSETKPAADSTTNLDTDSNENKTIFLDETSTGAVENCQINRTNFLDDDYKHLRDENVSVDNHSDKTKKAIDSNIEVKVPKNKRMDENLNSSIYETNISNNQITANDVEDDVILSKIDEILNGSGNSESILQSNFDFDKKDTPNDAEDKKKDEESSVSKVNGYQVIEDKAKYDTKQLNDNRKNNKTELCYVHNVDTDVEKAHILGSSTSKHGDEKFARPEEKISVINNNIDEYYDIEDSDSDEPSPEYEPLGEDITEDFRKHMQTIEQCVTDKKDEAQIVKICDEITKTVKQEILETTSPTKVQIENVKALEKSPITQIKPISLQEKSVKIISSKIQLDNDCWPKTTEKQKTEVHNISRTSLPDKSIEDLINELSPKKSPVNSNAECLKLNVTPHRTRSKSKKFNKNCNRNSEFNKNDKVSEKEPKIVENGDIDHKTNFLDKSTEHDFLTNGMIEKIYSKMCANEPKVVLTPLKNINKETPKTDRNKRSVNKLKLSLKKNRIYEIDSSDLDTSVDEPTIKEESKTKSKVVPVENGIEATIPISKQNGHSSNNTSKIAEDDEFDVDAASISSDDSHVSSVNTSIPTPRRSSRCRTKFANGGGYAEFLHYFELRQDYLLDEYPGLDEDEIETYLQKTWEYEESLKCDVKKNDDMHHSNLMKGLKQEPSKKETNNKKSKKAKPKNCIENYFPDRRDKKKVEVKLEPVIKSEETAVNHITDIQPSVLKSNSSTDKNLNESIAETKTTPKSYKENTVNEIQEITPVKPTVTIDLTEDKLVSLELGNKIKVEIDTTSISNEVSTPRSSKKKRHSNADTAKSIQNETQKISVKSEDRDTESMDSDSEIPLRQLRSKVLKEKLKASNESSPIAVKEESDVISVHSDDEPLTKNKKKKNDKKTENSYENPEFVKFLELRQDALIDENPQLTREEIIDYLYKTWLYEESSKSDMKRSDEIEQSNLVKGLNQDVAPKKVKRKQKLDKTTNKVDEELNANREKPKRKTVQPFYNEEFYSDIEEEIELFEIFRKKPTVIKKEVKKSENITKDENSDEIIEIEDDSDQITINDKVNNDVVKQDDVEMVDEVAVLDSWETYFADLLKPKPNVFKGLVREKVCEICEKTSNLYKCKGCNGMFHPGCLKKVEEVIEINTPNRGRKKKKKPGRRHKNLEDSESQSDEKPLDISDERNMSVEEIMTETCTFDAETLEAQISEKMKEMLNSDDVHYDSYSSDDGIDWSDTVAGKCEIVDVKLKPKTPAIDYTNFKCNNCEQYDTPVCFVCKLAVSKNDVKMRQKCHIAQCHKYYHLECLDQWPQTQFLSGEPSRQNKKINEFFEALSCPRHVCHTCVSDDPRGCRTRFSGDKLARCVRCPATYHSFTKCLPAGSQILTGSQIICPRHYQHVVRPGKVPCHVNTGWCFICALGGSLICCEYCPTSFHAECLNIKPPEGNYMCEDCETGRLPLYGEMVWVKLGHYRWWPGIILHPSEISENLMSVKHTLGEFVVRFFGQYDHYWVNRGRVFPYQEGDSGRISNQKTKIDAAFTTAMEHAQRAFEILKNANPNEEESLDIASSLLPPHYVKLKCNKPCGSLISRREDPALSLTQCECDPEENDPCGPYSHCLNRMLLTECGPTCRAGDRCNNRAFEKRLYPKLVPYRTPHRGWGLKTLQEIKAGQFVIEYVGELIDEEEFRRRMRRKHEIRDENYYFLTLDKERMIDAGPKGNLARFMNHCCEPNCETQKWTVLGDIRVGLFALNDIPANSEVTFNYNLECAGIDKKRCMCGAKRCAGYIGAKPKQDENQSKKSKTKLSNHSNKDGVTLTKRVYNKKRKTEETIKTKPKRPLGRPPKPKELSEIEKDLLIIKNATNDNTISSENVANNSTSSKNDTNNISSSNNSTDDLLSSKNSTTNSESCKKSASNSMTSSENVTNNLISSQNTAQNIINIKNTTNNNITSSKNSIKNITKAVVIIEKATENLTSSKNGTNDNIASSKTLTINLISSKNSGKNFLNSEITTDKFESCKNTTRDDIKSSINTAQNILISENTAIDTLSSKFTTSDNISSSENNTNSSEKPRTQSLDEKPKSLKRKLISNSIEESSISSSSAPKRRKCDKVGD